jgi:hypothetical protein
MLHGIILGGTRKSMSQYFGRNDQLLSRAAVANEGKIHLGYMYANDGSHSTARLMTRGALFTMAPYFADVCASRIPEDSRL